MEGGRIKWDSTRIHEMSRTGEIRLRRGIEKRGEGGRALSWLVHRTRSTKCGHQIRSGSRGLTRALSLRRIAVAEAKAVSSGLFASGDAALFFKTLIK